MARRQFRRRARSWLDYLLAGLFMAAVAIAAAWLGSVSAPSIAGPFRVLDGDSLEADGRRMRLEGIDAPEYRQMCRRNGGEWPCGRMAAQFLRDVVAKGRVECRTHGIDKYERHLVRCSREGVDINAVLVENGWAMAYGDYHREEDTARQRGAGVWAGEFDRPRDWREIHGSLEDEAAGDALANWFRWLVRRISEMIGG